MTAMSRGLGALQRQVLDALIQRRENDSYPTTAALAELLWPIETPVIRAWYTLDLLDLVQFGAPRSERVSLHRAVHGLHGRHRVQIATARPYDQPFGAYQDYYGH